MGRSGVRELSQSLSSLGNAFSASTTEKNDGSSANGKRSTGRRELGEDIATTSSKRGRFVIDVEETADIEISDEEVDVSHLFDEHSDISPPMVRSSKPENGLRARPQVNLQRQTGDIFQAVRPAEPPFIFLDELEKQRPGSIVKVQVSSVTRHISAQRERD